jgi:hypothetical protein
LEQASDLAQAVLSGSMPLNEAYAKAKQIKEELEAKARSSW